MSTAQVVNSGISGVAARASQARYAVSSSFDSVGSLSGAFAPPARDQTPGFEADDASFETPRRRRRHAGPFQDRVVSFGGVLVSHEVGATIMQAQAAQSLRNASPLASEAERGVAVYEFNQALAGTAQIMSAGPVR
jgi:hypothetical protein